MTSAVLIPGAGGLGWYWHLVVRDLQDRGYDAFAVDLAARGRTGLPAYADAVVDAIDGRTDVALIAQSMGGLHRAAGVAAGSDQLCRVRQRDGSAAR
jgi:alpha-beta hydrolase superfamily lysophospholipase